MPNPRQNQSWMTGGSTGEGRVSRRTNGELVAAGALMRCTRRRGIARAVLQCRKRFVRRGVTAHEAAGRFRHLLERHVEGSQIVRLGDQH